MSSVPLGENLIPIQRGLTTSSTAIFIPFITQELFQTGAALYYGLNALSNNMILCDRKQLKNPNGLILGTPGSGKSFAAKREMTNAFLITDDDIIICDPEAEYFSLVQRLDGQVIRLSPTGKGIDGKPQYVNPMDINLNYSEDDSPLALKSDFILSLCELVIGGNCILLDDGDECVCPQLISYSLLCKWFRVAVLPADRLLYAELYQTGDKKKCTECGAFFASTSNSVKYCPVCRKRITRRQAAERMRKRRTPVTQ